MTGVGEETPHSPFGAFALFEGCGNLRGRTIVRLDQLADIGDAAEHNGLGREVAGGKTAQFRCEGDQRLHSLRCHPACDQPRRNDRQQ